MKDRDKRISVSDYLQAVVSVIRSSKADIAGKKVKLAQAVVGVIGWLNGLAREQSVILIGNGGSAAIASEVSNRFWKFCKIKSWTFNDPVSLTSTANDFGWKNVFAQPLLVQAQRGDVLIAISSSGQSKNIITAVTVAQQKDCKVITLSGFDPKNPLRKMGDYNFYVPSKSYRHVERTHLTILDCILDLLIESKGGKSNEHSNFGKIETD